VSGPLSLQTMQSGGASFSNERNKSYNYGHTEQTFTQRSGGLLYSREVKADNLTLLWDSNPSVSGAKELKIQK
jgi:hypothetical protein